MAKSGYRARRPTTLEGFDLQRLTGFDIRKLQKCYISQRWQAEMARNIVWDMTFIDWLNIWLMSGRLGERGRYRGQYVMARFEDKGPYKIGNIQIISCDENVREAHLGKHEPGVCSPLRSIALKGKPKTAAHREKIAAANRSPEKREKSRIAALAFWAQRKRTSIEISRS